VAPSTWSFVKLIREVVLVRLGERALRTLASAGLRFGSVNFSRFLEKRVSTLIRTPPELNTARSGDLVFGVPLVVSKEGYAAHFLGFGVHPKIFPAFLRTSSGKKHRAGFCPPNPQGGVSANARTVLGT